MTEAEPELKNIPLPAGAQIKITKEPENKWKNRWSYRMAKREFRKERRIAVLTAIGDDANKAKAYRFEIIGEIIKLIIYCIFTAFMVIYGPEFVPNLIKSFFAGV